MVPLLLAAAKQLVAWVSARGGDGSASQRIEPHFDTEPSFCRLDPLFYSFAVGRPALVVIDMQEKFLCMDGSDELYRADWQALIDEVEALVIRAVELRWKVFVLEFAGYGSTLWQINRHLQGYPLAVRLDKEQRDGSREVLRIDETVGGSGDYLVCGVYADQCVAATVTGLAKKQPHSLVKVMPSACRPYEEAYGWEQFPTAANVQLARAA